jgi:chemotaxis signal transduction protein
MTDAAPGLAERATALRSAFDRAFTAPLRLDGAVKHDLIAVRVGGEACAIRLAEVAGLFADRKITRVPGGKSALIGIAGFRGTLVPAYNLRTLLGIPGAQTPRWLVIAAVAPVALAFDAFEGHLRVSANDIVPQQSYGQAQSFAPSLIRTGILVRPVIDLACVVAALGAAEAARTTPSEE